jgi:hypothetical protein
MTMRYQFTGGQSGVNDPVDPNTRRGLAWNPINFPDTWSPKRSPKSKAKRNTRQQPQQQTFNDPVDPTRQTGVKTNNLPSGIQQQAPQATPVPFPQQLVQSGMMNMNPIWDTSSGQGVHAPGYSINPMHPAWSRPVPYRTPEGTVFGGEDAYRGQHGLLNHWQGGQFRPGMNPMDYYGSDFFRNTPHYQAPNRNFGNSFQGVPRVWTGREMTPEGFRGIMNQYGANIPWMRQMQMNPFGF